MIACGVSDDSMHLKKICIGASCKLLQKEQSTVFIIPKVHSFLLRKSSLLRTLY